MKSKPLFCLLALFAPVFVSSLRSAEAPPPPALSWADLKKALPGYLEFDPKLDRALLAETHVENPGGVAFNKLNPTAQHALLNLGNGKGQNLTSMESNFYTFAVRTVGEDHLADLLTQFKMHNEDYKEPIQRSGSTDPNAQILEPLNAAWEIGPMRRWIARLEELVKAQQKAPAKK
jgi:hypothetical protein